MGLRSVAIALLAGIATGCTSVSCGPDFIVNTWTPPSGMPPTDAGQLTVRQKLAEVESISFITCNYDD